MDFETRRKIEITCYFMMTLPAFFMFLDDESDWNGISRMAAALGISGSSMELFLISIAGMGIVGILILAVDKEYHPHSIGFKKEGPDSIQRDSGSENPESEPEFVSESHLDSGVQMDSKIGLKNYRKKNTFFRFFHFGTIVRHFVCF